MILILINIGIDIDTANVNKNNKRAIYRSKFSLERNSLPQ